MLFVLALYGIIWYNTIRGKLELDTEGGLFMAMRIPKWSKRDLKVMDAQGYKIVPCKDEAEVESTYNYLKANKRCAQVGHVVNQENKVVFFVITKERGKSGAKNG